MNTKAILAGTILTAVFAGSSAMADDIGFDVFESFNTATTESVVMDKVNFQAPSVVVEDAFISGQR